MKTKPIAVINKLLHFSLGTRQFTVTDADELLAFLKPLPDQFDIVEPGKVQVEWPKELTRERLEELAIKSSWASSSEPMEALNALAAIAPKKRMRMVNIWRHDIHKTEAIFNVSARPEGWSKVNASPVEIED